MISSSGIVEVDVVLYEYSTLEYRVRVRVCVKISVSAASISRLHRAARSGGSETTRSRERAAGE